MTLTLPCEELLGRQVLFAPRRGVSTGSCKDVSVKAIIAFLSIWTTWKPGLFSVSIGLENAGKGMKQQELIKAMLIGAIKHPFTLPFPWFPSTPSLNMHSMTSFPLHRLQRSISLERLSKALRRAQLFSGRFALCYFLHLCSPGCWPGMLGNQGV